MAESTRRISIVGRLGVFPSTRLTLPARRILTFLALHPDPVSRGVAGWVSSFADDLQLEAHVDLPDARRVAARALDNGELTLAEITMLSEDLLPGWHEEWVLAAQDAFHLLRVQALEAACITMANAGHYALATQAGTAALASEPLRESAAAALIRAHVIEGNRYAAARRFHDFSSVLHQELGVAPNASLLAALNGDDRP
jgi:DNA-binding SARP family transcriptional activator